MKNKSATEQRQATQVRSRQNKRAATSAKYGAKTTPKYTVTRSGGLDALVKGPFVKRGTQTNSTKGRNTTKKVSSERKQIKPSTNVSSNRKKSEKFQTGYKKRTAQHLQQKRQNQTPNGAQLNRFDPNSMPNFSPQFKRFVIRSAQGQDHLPTLLKGKTQSINSLKMIPIGGLCEIGKNMTVYEYGNDMIIVDVGVAFPEETQPGIDAVIPDMHYVLENRHKLRGIFLTHGHEDHIGSLSWLLRDVRCPIYGGRLTNELVKHKLEDRGLKSHLNDLHIMEAGDVIKVGAFSIEAIHVNHSIADAFSFAIRTPEGVIIHSGDFKIDYTPIHGQPIDLNRFAELGNQGVLLFVCESTNIERKGFTSSEKTVGEAFATHFKDAPGRIIVATFSSNIHRVQQVVSAAEHVGRKVALVGRSMLTVFQAANNLGYIDIKPDTLIDISDVKQYKPDELVIITTGSQGEPLAALTRMAFSEHRFVDIDANDTVIISATPIPGNEKPIYRVINELYKRGAKVVYSALADIHVSGHAYREEIKIMHQLIRPQYFVPCHGEYRHLQMHAELAHEMGQPWSSIYVLHNGDMLEFKKGQARISGYTETPAVLIDGSPNALIDDTILDQRRTLSDDGVVSIAFALDIRRQTVIGRPIIQTRGFIYEKDVHAMEAELIKRIQQFVLEASKSNQPLVSAVKGNALRQALQNILYHRTQRRPVLLLSVLEA